MISPFAEGKLIRCEIFSFIFAFYVLNTYHENEIFLFQKDSHTALSGKENIKSTAKSIIIIYQYFNKYDTVMTNHFFLDEMQVYETLKNNILHTPT